MKLGFIALNFLAAVCSSSAVDLITPNTPTAGGNTAYPFWFTPCHYQQSYDASLFSLLGTNGGYINFVAFRGGSNNTTFNYAMTVSLSSTPLAYNALQNSFMANIGPDNAAVYSSNWTMGVFPPGNSPLQFQFVIPFSPPFFYNPTNGNLLLDILITNYVSTLSGLGPASLSSDGTFPNYPLMCRVFGYGNQFSPAPTNGAIYQSSGLVTEFGVTPIISPSYRIGKFTVLGTNVICGSTNGAPGVVYTLLTSTNLATANWVPITSNVFDTNGSFLFTNRVATNSDQEFYFLNLASH